MSEYKSRVGKKLIEILMFSMYPDAKIIYREYIQNARDAIKDAVDAGVLNQYKDGHIVVDIDKENRRIRITDNGIGVPMTKVESVLLDIADSTKDGINSAGQFGIGRLVGGGYCKTLSFKTSTKGEAKASEITFDVEAARSILDDDNDRRSADEVIDAITTIESHDEDEDKHYFTVTLDNVRPEYPDLLYHGVICNYLKDVAPIDYQFVFKNKFLTQTDIPADYVGFQKQVGHFKISVNQEPDIRKQYGITIDGTQDEIYGIEYFKIEDDTYGLLAWGWYAVTAFSEAIPTRDKNRGIRLRKHNILIGSPDLLNQFFKEPRGNNYFYGEIHAVHPKLKPESSRSGLAPTPEAIRFQELLKGHFDTLYHLYHLASKMKIATRDIVTTQTEIAQGCEPEDVPKVTQKLEQAHKKLSSAVRSTNAQTEVGQKVVEIYKKKLEEKEAPTITPVLTFTQSNEVPTPTKPIADKFSVLDLKYSATEIALIKKICKLMKDYCPVAQTRLVDELTGKVVEMLGK
jgi:molecular chaperone HtpG